MSEPTERYYPEELDADFAALEGDATRIQEWMRQVHEHVMGYRAVLREVQLIAREGMRGSKAKRNEAIQKVHDIITASYPDFDEIELPDNPDAILDNLVERGLMERTIGGFRLTLMGRAYVAHQLKTNPEMRDFWNKLDNRLGA